MKRLIPIIIIFNFIYCINGTITFYDGTTLKGELSSSDTKYLFIIPTGLVMPEKIAVSDIEYFNLDNGITLIEDGISKQTYLDGKFSTVERIIDNDNVISSEPKPSEDYDLGNLNNFTTSLFYGMPIYFRPSLKSLDGANPVSLPNLGVNFSFPYFPVGPINMSFGGRLITLGFDTPFLVNEEEQKIKSITLAGLLFMNLNPILNFLGDNIHTGIETGLTYSLGWEENYTGGLGVVVGGNLDYWFEDLPFAVRMFGNGYMIPSPNETLTGFGNIGISLVLALKRND